MLERLCRLVEEAGDLRVNFEDLTGITFDISELRLSSRFRMHTCDFCAHARESSIGHGDCIHNKILTNKLAKKRNEGFMGQCHLGVTDMVEPVFFCEREMGVFYYGSVLLEGTEGLARERIFRYCARRNFDPEPYLDQMKNLPRIHPDDVPVYLGRLKLLRDFMLNALKASGLPVARYRTEMNAQFLSNHHQFSQLVQSAMRYVHRNYEEELSIERIASELKCHPTYLSRSFKKNVGFGLAEYVKRVRIDHSIQLLAMGRFSVGEICYIVGFQDQSHFGKVFRSFVGVTPNAFRESCKSGRQPASLNLSSPLLSNVGSL
ncbi:helix-turn-helix domain-containing protein [Coraliomargarita sp. SDUM461004]|uniref:Helix-turn-helix domain-containing protein n=1 Tax=Thalassobacterium sedimentorum TaxID=3041258 RepID=A0ABU1AMU9_9BACT|nr:helix-turn-helix domain-containing protein [Coraliomargarita sp. SDUM461004]MDQ8196119.1 helix-turn-helix domain-containing protein [Coraliomargarita sp. SDUM461004]